MNYSTSALITKERVEQWSSRAGGVLSSQNPQIPNYLITLEFSAVAVQLLNRKKGRLSLQIELGALYFTAVNTFDPFKRMLFLLSNSPLKKKRNLLTIWGGTGGGANYLILKEN